MRSKTLLPLLALLSLVGCGGGGSDSGSSPAPVADGRGNIEVRWPSREGRFIPYAANSVKIDITLDGQTTTKTLVRSGDGASLGTASFTGLKYGTYSVKIQAYPTTDATGVAQAKGMGSMYVDEDTVGDARVSLATNAVKISILPVTAEKNATTQVSITAQDENDAIVLLDAGGQESAAWSIDATTPAVASFVGATNKPTVSVKGVHSGATKLRATVTLGTVTLTAPPVDLTITGINDGTGTISIS